MADVDGAPLWFESEEDLRPVPEAFACALLPTALARGADLVVEGALDPFFAANVLGVVETFGRWWGYAPVAVRGEASGGARAARPAAGAGSPGPETGLCFSGGADSFYTLLCGEVGIDALVFLHGFDIPLDDERRAEDYRRHVARVAADTGARPVFVRTNFREHPASRGLTWGRAHGGVLAAVGHALSDVSRLVVAASYPVAYSQPWGSRWDLDPFWSSRDTALVHHGADRWRADKVRRLADQPLAQRHLRVCLENRGKALNCSRCEKCLRTMLVLNQCGALARFATFDTGASLATCVGGLKRIRPALYPVYAGFAEGERDPALRRAILDLLARSRRRARTRGLRSGWKRLRRTVRGTPP